MIKLSVNYAEPFVSDGDLTSMRPRVESAYDKILNGTGEGSDFLGWRDWPTQYDRGEFARLKTAAAKIRDDSDVLVVIGIGGSYLGARAVIELLGGSGTEVVFTGNHLSSIELQKILDKLSGRNWSINVISKSGTTLEPAAAFRILRERLIDKYGEAASERIYATTDAERGTLHDLAIEKGYERFVVPDDVGGRYSVLTAVGLLPIAAAGIDIDELMSGAASAMATGSNPAIETAMQYAALRNVLYEKGFTVEILASFEPSFHYMAEWWKQLFGESEGKDGRGILPDSMTFTTDLHSLGQYVQEGKRQIFETFVNFEKSPVEIVIPSSDDNGDGLGYLGGQNLSYANQKAYEATALAHFEGGVPVMSLNLPEISVPETGYFIYFMEMSAAISAYILGVNPFDQPGVEAYKKHMFRLLGREG